MPTEIRSLAAAVLAGLAALAPLSARAFDCARADSQADLTACAGAHLARADAALNAVYGRMVEDADLADRLDKLRAAERAWIDYRRAQCDFEGSAAEGGSMQPMLDADCAAALTEQRTKDLGKVLACTHDPKC